MTPDTLEGSIHDLTQNILADYTAGRPIDRIEPFNQPDRDVIIALIGKLRRIVFPGYFRDPAYHVYSAAHSLSALIEDGVPAAKADCDCLALRQQCDAGGRCRH